MPAQRPRRITLEIGSGPHIRIYSYFGEWLIRKRPEDIFISSDLHHGPANPAIHPAVPEHLKTVLMPLNIDKTARQELDSSEPREMQMIRDSGHEAYAFSINATNIPFKDETLDEIVAKNVVSDPYTFAAHDLPHLRQKCRQQTIAALDEFHRTLKPGGTIRLIDNITPKLAWHDGIIAYLKGLGYRIRKVTNPKRYPKTILEEALKYGCRSPLIENAVNAQDPEIRSRLPPTVVLLARKPSKS